jgi:hypothetical protein
MKRAFNYTGRKPIPASAVKVSIIEGGSDGIPAFDAVLDGLKELGLEDDNQIVLEPYVGVVAMRFECGTISAPALPDDRRLTDIDLGAAIRFRVLVIDGVNDPSRIVAAGVVSTGDDADDDNQRSILYLKETASLKERLWKLDIAGGAMPELLINSRFPGLKAKLLNEPMYQGLVFPAVVRELVAELVNGAATDDSEWVVAWTTYAETLSGRAIPEGEDEEEAENFIEDCVTAFCDQRMFVESIIKDLKGQGND